LDLNNCQLIEKTLRGKKEVTHPVKKLKHLKEVHRKSGTKGQGRQVKAGEFAAACFLCFFQKRREVSQTDKFWP